MQKHHHSSSKGTWSEQAKFVLDKRLHSCSTCDSIRMKLDMLHRTAASTCMGSSLPAYCLTFKHEKDSMIDIFQSTIQKNRIQKKSAAR